MLDIRGLPKSRPYHTKAKQIKGNSLPKNIPSILAAKAALLCHLLPLGLFLLQHIAKMNEADFAMERNERDASPERFINTPPGRRSNEIERIDTASSSSASSSEGSAVRRDQAISRMSTQRDLERHPTMLSRIQTAKSQHTGTVGRSFTGKSRDSRKPLPEMGLGKPYPPKLPAQEQYVVEFDGPDDPLHAQNWPMRKK